MSKSPMTPPSFAELVAARVAAGSELVELCCGENAAVGWALRASGMTGPITFVDWRSDSLATHRQRFGLETDARWLVAPSQTLRGLDGVWLLVHLTLPRWSSAAGVIKPRGSARAARMIHDFGSSGARGAMVLALGSEIEAVRLGLRALNLEHNQIENVRGEHAQRPEPDEEDDESLGTFFCFQLSSLR